MNYKKVIFIIFCLIVTIIYFNDVMLGVSLIGLIIVFSFMYQIMFSDYPLSQYKILVYTISIIMLLSMVSMMMSKIPFCEKLNNCRKSIIFEKKDLNGTK